MSTGLEGVDRMLGLGQGFTAHPRIDPAAATLAGFSWASKLDQTAVLATVRELGLGLGLGLALGLGLGLALGLGSGSGLAALSYIPRGRRRT